MQYFGINATLFDSPLTVPPHSHYFSCFPRDTVFGARYDAFRYKWKGTTFGEPPFTAKHSNRAIVHAIASIRSTRRPAATILTLPIPSTSLLRHARSLHYTTTVATFSHPRRMITIAICNHAFISSHRPSRRIQRTLRSHFHNLRGAAWTHNTSHAVQRYAGPPPNRGNPSAVPAL